MSKRSEKTKQTIQKSFLRLIEERNYPTLTMGDIAAAAGCSRATVYRQYGGKDQLLLDTLETVIDEAKRKLLFPHTRPDMELSQLSYFNVTVFYQHVAHYKVLYKALFNTTSGVALRRNLRRITTGALIHFTSQSGDWELVKPAPPHTILNLVSDMIVGAIILWLETDSDEDPAVLAEIVLRYAETGLFGFLNRPPNESDISFTPFTGQPPVF